MIQLEINAKHETIEPGSIKELRDRIQTTLPSGHVICRLHINGREIAESQLDEFSVGTIRDITVQSDTPQALARAALGETQEWIDRIRNALNVIANDYRLGRDKDGASRLITVIDALQVLVGLLQGIHSCIDLDPDTRRNLRDPWEQAEAQLKSSLEGLVEDLQTGDPVQIADRTAYALPRSLGRFQEILQGLSG